MSLVPTVVIKASSRSRIDELLKELAAESAATRESALARLTLIGGRAVGRLTALVDDAEPQPSNNLARVAALRALEGIGDARALEAAARAMDDPDMAVGQAAAGVLRVFLRGPHGARALEQLTRTAVDRRLPDAIRLTVIGALGDLDEPTLKPLFSALQDDPSEAVRTAVRNARLSPDRPRDDLGRLRTAAEHGVGNDPDALHDALVKAGEAAPLPLLRDVIERVRERESTEPPARRAAWRVARAAAHVVLARRGSRLALYDIRETLEATAEPLPVEFLTAVSVLGDVSCLEAIAAADGRAARSGLTGTDWWRRHLFETFHAIVSRERLTRRHAVMRKILKRWPEIVAGHQSQVTSKKTGGL